MGSASAERFGRPVARFGRVFGDGLSRGYAGTRGRGDEDEDATFRGGCRWGVISGTSGTGMVDPDESQPRIVFEWSVEAAARAVLGVETAIKPVNVPLAATWARRMRLRHVHVAARPVNEAVNPG